MRAFEVAARELSFTRAAEVLHITQSAVSHQVRHLESLWGLRLFQRRNRKVTLTPEGQALLPVVRDFFERLDRTLNELTAQDSKGPIRVTIVQSMAFKWLVPRLGHFNRAHPDIDVWISTSDDLVDFVQGDVDVAIRLGRGEWPGLHHELLLREYVFPVCSPQFLARMDPPSTPADLLHYPLLYRYATDICPRWRDWFGDAGVSVRSLPPGSRFPDTGMAVQAALDGQGVALARSAHVEDDLASGRLVKLFDIYSPSSVSYYLVCPLGRERHPRVAAFRDWLTQEAAMSQAAFDRVGIPSGYAPEAGEWAAG